MTKLCPRGKAAAKRKFRVYPSAYANAYASKICAGKIKDPSGTKRKDWGPKKASKGRMFTAAEVRALDESTEPKANPKKKERIMQSGDKDKIKLSKTNLKRYNIGSLVEESSEYRARQKYKVKKRGRPARTLNPDYEDIRQKKLKSKDVKAFQGGGMARGMGAAIKGGKFEGVF